MNLNCNFYCPQTGPCHCTPVDWAARSRAIESDAAASAASIVAATTQEYDAAIAQIETARQAAHMALDLEQSAARTACHPCGNGRGPRLATTAGVIGNPTFDALIANVEFRIVSGPDEHGGVEVALSDGADTLLRCPECLSPLRWIA